MLDRERPLRLYTVNGAGRLYRSIDGALNWDAAGFVVPATESAWRLVDRPGPDFAKDLAECQEYAKGEASAAEMGRLVAAIENRIHVRTDDVRAYQLPEHVSIDTIGRGSLRGDTFLLSPTSPALQALLQAAGR